MGVELAEPCLIGHWAALEFKDMYLMPTNTSSIAKPLARCSHFNFSVIATDDSWRAGHRLHS